MRKWWKFTLEGYRESETRETAWDTLKRIFEDLEMYPTSVSQEPSDDGFSIPVEAISSLASATWDRPW